MQVAPDRVTLSCPACSTPISAEVWRVVDVGQQPDLKSRLLRGQLNIVTCPSCAHRTAVATPLVYHDPEKELFLMLMPSQLGLSGEEQEKTIGQLTNLVINSLEAEQRKGYLFQPRTFFSLESLRSEILRAEGITEEMLEDQRQKGQLIQNLLEGLEDETSLKKLVEDNREHLDYEFFLFLSASIDQAREDGEQQLAEQLATLRNRLQQLVAPSQVPPSEALEGAITVEQLIQTLFSHRDDEDFKTLVAAARPVLDYQFYQALTGQIEAADSQGDSEKARQLTNLRTRLLDLTDQLDKEAREALERAAALLRQIVESENMEAAAEENVERMDAAFLTTLEANIIAAEESGQEETQEKLKKLKEHVVSLLEARLPPEMRLLNQLLSMPDLDSRRALLREQAELITDDFRKLLELIVEDLRTQGQKEAAEHLAEMVPEVQALLQTRAQDSTTGPES
jgi:hypothetical protein